MRGTQQRRAAGGERVATDTRAYQASERGYAEPEGPKGLTMKGRTGPGVDSQTIKGLESNLLDLCICCCIYDAKIFLALG